MGIGKRRERRREKEAKAFIDHFVQHFSTDSLSCFMEPKLCTLKWTSQYPLEWRTAIYTCLHCNDQRYRLLEILLQLTEASNSHPHAGAL